MFSLSAPSAPGTVRGPGHGPVAYWGSALGPGISLPGPRRLSGQLRAHQGPGSATLTCSGSSWWPSNGTKGKSRPRGKRQAEAQVTGQTCVGLGDRGAGHPPSPCNLYLESLQTLLAAVSSPAAGLGLGSLMAHKLGPCVRAHMCPPQQTCVPCAQTHDHAFNSFTGMHMSKSVFPTPIDTQMAVPHPSTHPWPCVRTHRPR